MRQECAREADVGASIGDRIEHADLACELHGIVEHRQYRARDHAHGLGALGQGGQKHDGVRTEAAVALEVMLDGASMGETELLGFFRDGERLVEIVARIFLLRADAREKLDAEFHDDDSALLDAMLL